MPQRVFNFSAGPAILPMEVLQQAAKDIVNYNNTGMGLIEMSHRSKDFIAITDETEALLRELMAIPANYKVLFLQGGASTQFAMVPMNLLGPGKTATYLNTGTWSKNAIKEAKLFGNLNIPFDSEPSKFDHLPTNLDFSSADNTEYLYFVSNNTIYGTQFQAFPRTKTTMVCDMSSDILSRPVNVADFGLIFAGAQKNMGPAGVTVVIIRDDLLDKAPATLPTMFKYKTHADKGSMFNTPPCFAIYCVGLVLKWLKAQGGVPAIAKLNDRKAEMVYQAIDSTDFYRGHAQKPYRSKMNITFNLPTPELEAQFVKEAIGRELNGLKGHRSVGGIRASVYNAFPMTGIERLVEFMGDFAKKNA